MVNDLRDPENSAIHNHMRRCSTCAKPSIGPTATRKRLYLMKNLYVRLGSLMARHYLSSLARISEAVSFSAFNFHIAYSSLAQIISNKLPRGSLR